MELTFDCVCFLVWSLSRFIGVSERAKRDLEEETAKSKPKKVVYIGGVAYVSRNSDVSFFEPPIDLYPLPCPARPVFWYLIDCFI